MALRTLGVRGFRNLREHALTFSSRVTVLVGDNAQGKTNFLEALYLLSNLKSFRTRRLADLLGPGRRAARIEGTVDSSGVPADLSVTVEAHGRTALLQGSPPESASQYLVRFPSVLFSPADLDLSEGDQEQRRAYVDRATFFRDPVHLARLRDWGRILRHRNAVLRSAARDVDVWDEQLAALGTAVRKARERSLWCLRPVLEEIFGDISGGADRLDVHWDHAIGGEVPSAETLLEELRSSRARDRELGYTTRGPHRDRLNLFVNGREVRQHGSRGQHRTVALCLKLALLRCTTGDDGAVPTFLVDDPGPELDPRRLVYLGNALSQGAGQVFLTCTDASEVPLSAGADVARFRVENGSLSSL